MKLHLVLFLSLFIAVITVSSLNYFLAFDSSFQLVEEEIHGKNDTSKKNFSSEEEHLSTWLTDFLSFRARCDHGVEMTLPGYAFTWYTAPLPNENPPPDRA